MRGLGVRENETGTGFMWSFIGFRVSDKSGPPFGRSQKNEDYTVLGFISGPIFILFRFQGLDFPSS